MVNLDDALQQRSPRSRFIRKPRYRAQFRSGLRLTRAISMLFMKPALGLFAASLLTFSNAALAESPEWPRIALPKNVYAFSVGEKIIQNGMPMHITGFMSSQTEEQLAAWFRQDWGKPYVEDRLGATRIIGRRLGDFYLSIQLEPILDQDGQNTGTRGLAAVTHLRDALERQEDTQESTDRWLDRLPSGSHILSQTASKDGNKLSRHMIFVNQYDETVNRERLQNLLAQDGLLFEQAVRTEAQSAKSSAAGQTLYFSGPGKEAMAVITRDAEGQVTTVLNITTQIERLP